MEFLEGLGTVALVLVAILGLAFLAVYIGSIIWAYVDAEKRGWNGLLVALLIAIPWWPFSLIVYFIIRPKTVARTLHKTDF